jgi:hypothetical protein
VRPIDTSVDAFERQLEAFRRMTPERRVELAAEMSDDIRALAMSGIRSRHPEYDSDQVEAALAELLVGPTLADRIRERTKPST